MPNQYTIDIVNLPSVTFADRANLPLTGGVYFVVEPTPERLCYIGKAQNLRARWSSHHRAYQMMPITRIHWFDCANEEGRAVLESRLIAFYCPHWNGRIQDQEIYTRLDHMQLEINALKADARQHHAQWLYMCQREAHFLKIEKALSHISEVARYMEVDRDELLARILRDWAYNRKEL
jgi:excinuclease UvrABC nuclease subunit